MINPISSVSYTYPAARISPIGQSVNAVSRINGITPVGPSSPGSIEKLEAGQCQTCKERKYVDGSNDSNVSFQTPTHISPEASFTAVSAHEQEHVTNAHIKGGQEGSRFISASVSLKMSVCPECGTPYISGGSTRSTIEYNTSNPYDNFRKSLEGSLLRGMNFDTVA
jgi:hypothetical protein